MPTKAKRTAAPRKAPSAPTDDPARATGTAAEAAYADLQQPAPHTALRYIGKGAIVAHNIPARDLTPAETARFMTRGAYRAGLDAGIYEETTAAEVAAPTGPGDAGAPATVPALPEEN